LFSQRKSAGLVNAGAIYIWAKISMLQLLKIIKRILVQYYTNIRLGKAFDCHVHHTVQLSCDSYDDIELAKNVYIGAYTILSLKNYPGRDNTHLKIGEDTYIGELNNIRASGGTIMIGRKCLISQNVNMIAANHLTGKYLYIKEQEWDTTKNYIVIEDDVWVGCGSIILAGVKIGKGAVIGAGSVVTKDVPEYAVVTGNPARVIKERV